MGSVLISQQAAEKAIKAVYQRSGAVRVGSFSSKVSGQPAEGDGAPAEEQEKGPCPGEEQPGRNEDLSET